MIKKHSFKFNFIQYADIIMLTFKLMNKSIFLKDMLLINKIFPIVFELDTIYTLQIHARIYFIIRFYSTNDTIGVPLNFKFSILMNFILK